MQWSVGDVKINLVSESEGPQDASVTYPEYDESVLTANLDWLAPFLDNERQLNMSIHSLILRSAGKVIVVDTCVGTRHIPEFPGLSDVPSPYLDNFAATGLAPQDVDVVVNTHLHVDHVGWNTRLVDGKWVPTFPNARYLFIKAEYDHWDAGAPGAAVTFADAVRPVYEAGLVDFVQTDHEITPEVRLEPSVGHSVGHVNVHVSSAGEQAVLTGDVLHHPLQFAAPHWHMFLDGDGAEAAQTRRAVMEQYADSGTRVFGAHFAGPHSGLIERAGDAFRLR